MTQDLYGRSKRDASSSSSSSSDSDNSSSSDSDSSSSESDDSSSESDDITTESSDDITTTETSDDITTESVNTTPVDECSLFRNFIESDLPDLPSDLAILLNYTLTFQTTQLFIDLLTSAPVLFANLSAAVDAASSQIMIPPAFTDDANDAALDAIVLLSIDFEALANDPCDISLNLTQQISVVNFFIFLLPFSFVLSEECNLLNVTIIEQAVASANLTVFDNNLESMIIDAVGIDIYLISILGFGFSVVISPTPDALVPAAAQALLDDFMFYINDVCGIEPLSNTTLEQLDEYFLVDLVEVALLE